MIEVDDGWSLVSELEARQAEIDEAKNKVRE